MSLRVASAADSDTSVSPVLNVPAGFSIELAAGPPLAQRPIVAAFDDEGRLYVAESSGSNDPVEKQLELRPHRIVRLDDSDGDGKFDQRTLYADHMMFPEGALFLDGSLYVSAPPSIWKLTDTDDDGVADQRIEWFQGKTLTGCANDLHGPYLGPDGWIYWCKGAFAEQTHAVNSREWTTRAAHIFRCRPDGFGFEPVLTGGMDNPVDVVFTPEGERILSATYLVGEGRRDGLVHAIYGGVYGKEHGVLAGHPRTGELMPAMVLMSPAAPCGLERYDSPSFGSEFRDNLFCCQFNLRKVSRHVLRPAGSSFISEDSDFVTSENVDFHPTDVLMDADGSLLVIDTGGWYKLCCPTSQLWKPDVLGGIYRVRRVGAKVAIDPRGQKIPWPDVNIEELWQLLTDGRPAVRQRATREFVRRRDSETMREFLDQCDESGIDSALSTIDPPSGNNGSSCDARTAAMARTWAVAQLENVESQALLRQLLRHADESVRHAALSAISLHRDVAAKPLLAEVLARDTPANRRVAAEALGRIGDPEVVPDLLAAAASANDRILQHSITYALIELAEPDATRAGMLSNEPGTVAAALVALDQMPAGGIKPEQVVPLLNSPHTHVWPIARWVIGQHADWGGNLADWFRQQLAALPLEPQPDAAIAAERELESLLVASASQPAVQALLTDAISQVDGSAGARQLALRVIANAKATDVPHEWRAALAKVIDSADRRPLPLAIAAARVMPPAAASDKLDQSLIAVADDAQLPPELRVAALAAAADGLPELSDPQFELLIESMAAENGVTLRGSAADALSRGCLTLNQLERLCTAMESAGPLELNRLLAAFAQSTDERLGLKLVSSLKQASALPSLRIDMLRETLAKHSAAVQRGIEELESLVNIDAAAQRRRIEDLLPLMAHGDISRGLAVFHSAKATCSACHRLGYAGGTVGPELTRIGETRTERDLLESILYPSLSFVRSYEPVLITTVDGRTINGTIRDETADEYVLATGPEQEVRVRRADVEEIQPSTVSIMPAGLDQQLSAQELADLVAFLKHAK